jgi:HK97 family phage portal protein
MTAPTTTLWQTAIGAFRRLFMPMPITLQSGGSDAGERIDERSVLGISAVWACVNLWAGLVGSAPLNIYRPDKDGNLILATDHWLFRILHFAPNADQTALDFWEGAQASLELKGNALCRRLKGSSGQLVGLEPMAWDYTTVTRNSDGGLVYRNGTDTLTADDVLHIRGFGGAPTGGLSTIAFCANAFGLVRATDRSASAMFANGVRSTGVISVKQQLDAPKRGELESALQAKFSGAMNAGRPMVLDNEATWTALTINPVDAQMIETRGFGVEEVCRIFGTPPVLVGHTSKTTSWPTGVEQQVLILQKFPLGRRFRRIELALEQQLLTPADRAAGIRIKFDQDSLQRGDSEGRAKFYNAGLQNGWFTINEVRKRENLPPVEGGDVPRMQMQNVPITEAENTVAAPKPPAEED